MMGRISLLAVALFSVIASAQPAKRYFKQAEDALDGARRAVRESGPLCRRSLDEQLGQLDDRVERLWDEGVDEGVNGLKFQLAGLARTASMAGCTPATVDELNRAIEALEDGRQALWERNRPNGNNRPDRAFATLSQLKVTPNSVFGQEPAVRVSVPEVKINGLGGRTIYFAVKYRSYASDWSEWVTTQQWSVPRDQFAWKNAFNHFIPYSALAEEDHANGRFVVHVALFDNAGRELAFRESSFQVRVPQLPPMPMPIGPPPVAVRDCGTGQDPGCAMSRDGQWPADAITYGGLMQALRANRSDFSKVDMVKNGFARMYLTAMQLGGVMDVFDSDFSRLEAVKSVAARVVNPQHALGFGSKFRSNMVSRDFIAVMAAQQQGQVQVVQVQPLMPPPPPPNRPSQQPYQQPMMVQPVMAARDCGTGNDPGCMMTRNGLAPMDGVTFGGLLQALKGINNQFSQADMVKAVLANSAMTALQLKQVLELFSSDMVRLDVAKVCAPRVVNPQHALGLATLFQSSFSAQDYTKLMASQR